MNAQQRGERIAKYLARAGVASRRVAETLIAAGRVTLNGKTIAHPATFVAGHDVVELDGKPVLTAARLRLWRYHKPAGLITTHKDPEGRRTVFQHLPGDLGRVISVGRLDLNSEGLLLLTNSGALAHALESPATGWRRCYRVRAFGNVDEKALAALSKGITIEGIHYGPIDARLDSRRGKNSWLTVSITEGRNREIRRVLAHLGLMVTRLIRIAYGPFQLGSLPRGAVEEIPSKVLREQLPLSLKDLDIRG